VPPEGITPTEWEQTPPAVRTLVQTLREQGGALQAQVQTLQAQVADLQTRRHQHSGNSSRPPSSDPPAASKRPARPPRGRPRGGQPGHVGHARPLVPPEPVDRVVEHRPAACPHCHTALAPDLPNMDETGWKQAGQRRWLWVAVTALLTLFRVDPHRSAAALPALLGTGFAGLVGSDRYSAYEVLLLARRQLCWAHLKRDMTAFAEREGAVGAWGRAGLAHLKDLFTVWHAFRQGTLDRAGLQAALEPVQAAVRTWLEAGLALELPAAAQWSRAGRARGPALWAFAYVEGVEPTNNAAERALRPAVLWRKGCFGAVSSGGNEFVERIWTVIATCRQQERHLWSFLGDAVQAYWAECPAPSLLPTP